MRGPVLVIGPGAIGALVAARLASAGHEVVVACRKGATAEAVRRDGVSVVSYGLDRVQSKVPVVTAPEELGGRPGLAVLATKCDAALPALRTWLPALHPDASVVAVQNGVLGDDLSAVLGPRLVECTVGFPATLVGPGQSEQTGPGRLYIGPWPEATPRDDPARFKEVARVLSAAAPVQASPNMRGVKWSKLLVNSCITTLGAATGTTLGNLLRDARARRVFLNVVTEGHQAGLADGVRFEAVEGFRPRLLDRTYALPGDLVRDLGLRLKTRRFRAHRSSSLQSLERGERTEVDHLNGRIVATAARHGLPAPVNSTLVRLIHDIESGRRKPNLANLDAVA